MKRLILTVSLLLSLTALAAQNYIVVDSEKARQYQAQVDGKYAVIEQLYENYMAQKASLPAQTRQSRENAILEQEKEAQQYQESLFGNDGTLMKKRQELILPIQKRVFDTIDRYAKQVGADLVLDASNNPTMLYHSTRVDHTQQVIEALK